MYLNAAWIPENSKPIIVRVQSNIKGLSLLSVILEECKKMKIHACGICNERKPLNGGFVCSNFSFIIFKEQTNALHCKIYEKQVL